MGENGSKKSKKKHHLLAPPSGYSCPGMMLQHGLNSRKDGMVRSLGNGYQLKLMGCWRDIYKWEIMGCTINNILI
jgi:hypothetical protein